MVNFFIDRPVFSAVISIVITLVGAICILTLPIAQYPQIVPPTVQVSATYDGASAQVVEESVATPIEQEVNGVERMLYMSSRCTNDGQMTLDVTFELGTNLPVLSMAWILQHPEISCVIAGASKPSQLENNMKAAGFVIPADAMAEIDKITGFHRFERHVG